MILKGFLIIICNYFRDHWSFFFVFDREELKVDVFLHVITWIWLFFLSPHEAYLDKRSTECAPHPCLRVTHHPSAPAWSRQSNACHCACECSLSRVVDLIFTEWGAGARKAPKPPSKGTHVQRRCRSWIIHDPQTRLLLAVTALRGILMPKIMQMIPRVGARRAAWTVWVQSGCFRLSCAFAATRNCQSTTLKREESASHHRGNKCSLQRPISTVPALHALRKASSPPKRMLGDDRCRRAAPQGADGRTASTSLQDSFLSKRWLSSSALQWFFAITVVFVVSTPLPPKKWWHQRERNI